MQIFRNPDWIDNYRFEYKCFDEIPLAVFNEVNANLDKKQTDFPLVSIVIAAWNEEVNILGTIASLSELKTDIPFEIIVVNNNSTDKTQETLDKLHVRSFFEKVQGAGPARQKGQEIALGKYILTADADCIYPSGWLDEMLKELQKPGVACVYGRYSFISEQGMPRWNFIILETLKDIIAEVRHFKRPYLNSYGISMGYIKEYGLKVGFVKKNIRGEDGRLCFDLMQFGKVKQVKSRSARVWTAPRTILKDGTVFNAIKVRVVKEAKRFFSLFFSLASHDTKTSVNE